MNKKFSTLVAALMAAGALVLPTDLFAQLQYTEGEYADQVNGTLPTNNKAKTFYLTFEENGVEYVAYVSQNTLTSIPMLHAKEDMKVTVSYNKSSKKYSMKSADGTLLGAATGYSGLGSADTNISNFVLNSDGTIKIEYGIGFYVNRDGINWDGGTTGFDATFKGKLVASEDLTTIQPARPVVSGDIDFSKPYVIMAAGQVLDADKEGEASFAYVGKQSTYWTLEKHETTATAGYALLKNKETGKYMTIGGDEVAIKLTKNGDKWGFTQTTDGFQLYVITDWNTAKAVEMDGVDMTSFQLGEAYENVPVTASELSKIFGSSFNVELKKGNDALLDNPFSGNIKPVALEVVNGKYTDKIVAPTRTDYFLQKANGNIIAVQVNKKYADATATYGYAVVEVSAHDLALALNGDKVDGKEYVYAPFFTIYASEDFAAGIDTDVDYIIATDKDNNEYRLGSLNYGGNDGKPTLSAENGNVLTYLDPITVKIGAFNTVDVKKLLASPAFFTLTNKNTKKDYSYNHYGKVLGLSQDGSVDWVEADEALVGYPETEWAITYDEDAKTLTFKNRENPGATCYNGDEYTIHESQLYNIDGKTNVFAYQGDTIEFKANTQYKESDGYLRLDAQKLRDQLYYVGVNSSVWDGVAYVSENHKDNHQVGLDTDQENATKWNLAAAWYKEYNSLNEETVSRADTILVGSTMTYWDAAHNTFTTTDKDGKQTVFLKIMAFSLQNEENGEYMAYRWSDTRYATGVDSYGYEKNYANYFALKMHGDDVYNLVEVTGDAGERVLNYGESKVYGGSSANKGILNHIGLYKQVENDLFVIEETDAPEYLKLSQGDTIRIFRDEFDSNVLYEKGEFAGINNAVEFNEINPALYVDTAYVNRPGNNRWEYLLAVGVNRIDTTYQCNVPAHGIHHEDTTYGRFLVNLADSAIVEDTRDVHVNKFIYEGAYETRYARLGFVDGMHTNDTLVIASSNDSIAVGTPAPQLVKFAFRVVDHETESFVIETGYKDPIAFDGNKIADDRGYLAYINGNLVVVDEIEDAEVFRLNADETRTPTANEEISAEEATVSVVATDGAVIVKGAEGKNVVVSTILGKVVANEVLNSDNETIAAPAGIVVVSVDGESFKVAVK